MNTETARFLNELNRRFYDACAPSFSDTRGAAWPGWRGCLDALLAGRGDGAGSACCEAGAEEGALRVLDVACGNLRFESFLTDELGKRSFAACAVDACEPLARAGAEAFGLPVRFGGAGDRPLPADRLPAGETLFLPRDIVPCVLEGRQLGFSGFDAAVCFGFFHHVPGRQARIGLLDQLCATVRPGGVVAVSLWRFLEDGRLARKARETLARARIDLAGAFDWEALEEGDGFLGWQERSGVYRYAHSFSDGDIAALIDGAPSRAQLIARFRADGRSGDLNDYLVFRIA